MTDVLWVHFLSGHSDVSCLKSVALVNYMYTIRYHSTARRLTCNPAAFGMPVRPQHTLRSLVIMRYLLRQYQDATDNSCTR